MRFLLPVALFFLVACGTPASQTATAKPPVRGKIGETLKTIVGKLPDAAGYAFVAAVAYGSFNVGLITGHLKDISSNTGAIPRIEQEVRKLNDASGSLSQINQHLISIEKGLRENGGAAHTLHLIGVIRTVGYDTFMSSPEVSKADKDTMAQLLAGIADTQQ